jgi:glutathione peroxidase
MSIYDYTIKNAKNEDVSMSDFKGKVLLIVNTASECGFTNQYEGLEQLYKDHQTNGLEVLGFPCNQFGKQESGTDEEIQEFCQVKFGVKFPVFKKIDVNGDDTHPLYEFLKTEAPGLLGSKSIKWNFTKFLISKDGTVLKRFAPKVTPESMTDEIKDLL